MMEDEQPPKKVEKEQEEQEELEQYDTFLYRFQQQIIDAWKPVPYTSNNVILYAVLSTVCIGLGLALILTAPTTPEIQQRYDEACVAGSCSTTFTLSQALSPPVYVYYGLTNFYQNHRLFIKDFSASQLEDGNTILEAQASGSCGSTTYTNNDLGFTTSKINGATLPSNGVGWPCGPRAKSFYQIFPQIESFVLKDSSNNAITWNQTSIAWPHDIDLHVNSNNLSQQAFSVTNEHWLVWFRPAAKSNFFKLFARIESELPAGTYTFESNNSYDASAFGQKWVHLSKSNYVGNKDLFLGIAFLSLGGGCVILLIVFIAKCITERRSKPKQD